MSRKIFLLFIVALIIFVSSAFAQNGGNKSRAADEKAIREHIDSIFKAYMRKDRDTVKATHSQNWRGFLSNSTKILRGIDDYMATADGQGSFNKDNPFHIVDYKMQDFDMVFYGNTAIISYIAELFWQGNDDAKGSYKLRSIDIYAKEKGKWNQVASNIGPLPGGDGNSNSTLRPISAEMRTALMKARDEVWWTFFANDTEKLKKLVPAEIVAINPGQAKFDNQASILASAKAVAESGTKLVKLEFPLTEIQVYGSTVIMYSDYVYELEANGKKDIYKGRATEIFVMRNNTLENVGWHLDEVK